MVLLELWKIDQLRAKPHIIFGPVNKLGKTTHHGPAARNEGRGKPPRPSLFFLWGTQLGMPTWKQDKGYFHIIKITGPVAHNNPIRGRKSKSEQTRYLAHQLSNQVVQVKQELTFCIARLDKVPPGQVYLRYTERQQLLLLNLRVWSVRYRVPLIFITRTLLQYYHRVRGGRQGVLGISLRTLCGQRSQQIVEEAVVRAYPALENEALWYQDLQTRTLEALAVGNPLPAGTLNRNLIKQRNPDVAVRTYRQVLKHVRSRSGMVERILTRRPWLRGLQTRVNEPI